MSTLSRMFPYLVILSNESITDESNWILPIKSL